MKTDLEKFVELYKSFSIDCKVNKDESSFWIELIRAGIDDTDQTSNEKIEGYTGFYTRITFDHNGKFVSQGIWE